jgi:hypothetical protein
MFSVKPLWCDRAFASTRLLVAPDDDPECTESEILLGSGVQTDITEPFCDTGKLQLETPRFFPAQAIGRGDVERADSVAVGVGPEARLVGLDAAGPLWSSEALALVRATEKTTGLASEDTAAHVASGSSLQNCEFDVWEVEWQTTVRQDASVAA